MIKIQYKDKANWTDVNGIVTNHTNYAIKYKNERVQPAFMAPEIVQGSWDGKEYDEQHKRHDHHYIEITVKESEKKSISQLKSCSDIQIIDFEMNSSGTVINQTYVLDTTKSDYIEIEEIEANIGQTSGAKYSIKFRTNRTIINKALPVEYTNSIEFDNTTKLDVIDIDSLTNYKIFRLADNEALFIDSQGIQKRQYTSGNWQTVGNKLTTSGLANSEAAGLSSTQCAIVDTNGDLGLYDHDGTDWSLTGNKLSVASAGSSISLAKVDSNEVAVWDGTLGFVKRYSFSTPNWSQSIATSLGLGITSTPYISEWDSTTNNSFIYADAANNRISIYWYTTSWTAVNLSLTITGNAIVERISGSGVNGKCLLLNNDNEVQYYDITGSVLTLEDSLSISPSASPYMAQMESNKISLTTQNEISIIRYGNPVYHTDFDILDYSKDIKNFNLDWPDGTSPLARTIDKYGKEGVFYFETSDYDNFISDLKAANTITLNSDNILEYEHESTLVGEGLWKVIFKGVTSIVKDDKDLKPNLTYSMTMNSAAITYQTDYPLYQRIRGVQKIEVEWDDGGNKTLQTVKKKTYEFVFYTDDPASIITDVNTYNDVTISSDVLSEIETNPEEVLPGLFKVTISGVYDVDVDTIYTFPTSGNNLAIIDETPTTFNFYTDFDTELIPEGSDKNTSTSQTGVNITTKAITKEVKQVKFYLNETNAFSLKQKCELFKPGWTCTLNSSTVYEITNSDNIQPNKLGVDLYEVIVNCLMSVTGN